MTKPKTLIIGLKCFFDNTLYTQVHEIKTNETKNLKTQEDLCENYFNLIFFANRNENRACHGRKKLDLPRNSAKAWKC